MKYPMISILSVLSSCFTVGDSFIVQGPSVKKQKQKIAVLQKKLEAAEKERCEAESEIERLAREINEAKLALIRKQIDNYEKKKDTASTLFLEEREALYQLIQAGSPQAFEAQIVLDQILQLITELSDGEKSV